MRVLSFDPSGGSFFVDVTWDEYRRLSAQYEIDTGCSNGDSEEVIEIQKAYREEMMTEVFTEPYPFQQYLKDLYGIDDMPEVCLGVKRDLSYLWVDQYDYPFGHMWNGGSPWKKIETFVIQDLTDLAGLECIKIKEQQDSDIFTSHNFEETGAEPEYSANTFPRPMPKPEGHTVGSLLKQAIENMEKQRGPYNMLWSRKALTAQKVGTFCEYYAKMTLISYGVNIYTSEVDDHGIDFIAEGRNGFLKFQVKGMRGTSNYVFMQKEYFDIEDDAMYLFLVLLIDGEHPDMYIIPTSVWRQKSSVFVSHDYEGKKSKPDYGVNVSKRNMPELAKYRLEKMLSVF